MLIAELNQLKFLLTKQKLEIATQFSMSGFVNRFLIGHQLGYASWLEARVILIQVDLSLIATACFATITEWRLMSNRERFQTLELINTSLKGLIPFAHDTFTLNPFLDQSKLRRTTKKIVARYDLNELSQSVEFYSGLKLSKVKTAPSPDLITTLKSRFNELAVIEVNCFEAVGAAMQKIGPTDTAEWSRIAGKYFYKGREN